nr:hypothetical protein [Tanacetum cinerariifolium]
MNQNFYNSNFSGFDQTQPLQFPVIHQPPRETSIEILHDHETAINFVQTFLRKFNRCSFFETPKVLLLAWDRVFKIKDAFGNKQYKPEDVQELFRKLFNDVQNIHEELADHTRLFDSDSLIMGDEHLDTIPEKESDEFNKSSVEDLVPNPSEFEDECECDVPDCDDSQMINFSTFSNPLFDDSTSSADESIHEEDIHEMNLDSTLKNDRFDTDSYLLESLLNRDTLMISSLKIDSLLAEFVGELIFLESIPPGVNEANCDPEEDFHLVERLLYDNSSPQIDLFLTPDDPMPPSIEDDDDDSERDILILKELIDNYSISLIENESFRFDIPSFSRPPAKPPDSNT